MRYCPKCDGEFQDWSNTCPECGVPLEKEALPTDKREEPLVCVATAPNEMVAHLWAGILEDNGIHCLIKRGAPLEDFLSILTPVNVPCKIHVLASEANYAGKILQGLSEPE
jgi:hypothetical protein